MSVFATGYAGWYDTLYRAKDYPGECDYLEFLFGRLGVSPKTIVDLGCGTGGHSLLLAQRGYTMTAVDRSMAMLQAARAKADRAGVTVDFRQVDVGRLEWREAFDAAIAMFAVVGYQSGDGELEAMLAGVFRCLRPGGVFVFDGWHGSGVLRERPVPRLLEIPLDNDEVILRLADPCLNTLNQTVEVHYRLWHRRGSTIIAESEERHLMRYFFPRELHCLLRHSGFTTVSIHPFREFDQPLQEHHWHFMAVAGKGK
jgi:SAM-dependent methyltransferase